MGLAARGQTNCGLVVVQGLEPFEHDTPPRLSLLGKKIKHGQTHESATPGFHFSLMNILLGLTVNFPCIAVCQMLIRPVKKAVAPHHMSQVTSAQINNNRSHSRPLMPVSCFTKTLNLQYLSTGYVQITTFILPHCAHNNLSTRYLQMK
jgi:hypothetical protein